MKDEREERNLTMRTTASEKEILQKCKFLLKFLRIFKFCKNKKNPEKDIKKT